MLGAGCVEVPIAYTGGLVCCLLAWQVSIRLFGLSLLREGTGQEKNEKYRTEALRKRPHAGTLALFTWELMVQRKQHAGNGGLSCSETVMKVIPRTCRRTSC